jgi:diguanylate cyclase (GGDEF)-like protein
MPRSSSTASSSSRSPWPRAGSGSLALWLLPLIALAATLGLSVRTGIKATILSALVVGGVLAIEGADPDDAVHQLGPLMMTIAVVAVAGALTDLNDRQLRRQSDRMTALHDATGSFVRTTDPDELGAIALTAARRLLPGWDVALRLDGRAPPEPRTWRADGLAHLELPVATHERREGEEPPRPLGVMTAQRRVRRLGRPRLRGGQVLALRTLTTAFAVALERVDMLQRLEHLSMADPLTGLGNRRAFDEALAAELARARRAGSWLGLVLLDVDHFKDFNDRHGHGAGDEALTQVAQVIAGAARAEDLGCRIGGEEFALLLPGADEHAAGEVAERLRRAVEARRLPVGSVTVSLGVAASRGDLEGPALVAVADTRLYAAKEGGRNRVVAGAASA